VYKRKIYELGDVRVFSLDNGSGLKYEDTEGMEDLRGETDWGTRLERFDRETVERLRALGRRALGYGCEAEPFADEADAIWVEFFGRTREDQRDFAIQYLGQVLDWIAEQEEEFGEGIYLEDRDLVPVMEVP